MMRRHFAAQASQENDQMTADEIEIALSFLKKRFNQYSLDEILLSLSQYVQSQANQINQTNSRDPRQEDFQSFSNFGRAAREDEPTSNPRRTRITHHNMDQRELRENIFSISANNEEKLNKFQELRCVAKFFCETGINFSLVRYFFPDITPQKYRADIDTINNQTINEIQKFLRYECNIQIEHLSTDQKRSLKSQLIKVRDWLGQKSISQLETYYKFIERHYEQKNVEISYDEALKLYKTLLQIIKSPFVDIMEVIDNQERQIQAHPPATRTNIAGRPPHSQMLTKEEEIRVVEAFLRCKGLSRTCEHLNEKWGFSMKWSKPSIKITLKRCLRKSIKKVILSRDKYLRRGTVIAFGDSDAEVSTIFQSEEAEPIKEKLFKFFIANRITVTGLTNVIKELNFLFNRQEQSQQIQMASSDESVSIIPKIQAENKRENSPIHLNQQRAAANEEVPEIKEETSDKGISSIRGEGNMNEDKQTEATEQQLKRQIPPPNRSRCCFQQVIEID